MFHLSAVPSGTELPTRPYLFFVLELFLAEAEGRIVFQSCLSTEEAPANIHRRSARLE